jgi:cytochrome c
MKRIAITAFLAATTIAAVAHAVDSKAGEALAKNNGCLACHTVDKKLVGPSYQQIAEKYRKDKGAEASLVKKVKAGGKGVWGDIPMPPNAHVKDADIQTMVQWILSLR